MMLSIASLYEAGVLSFYALERYTLRYGIW